MHIDQEIAETEQRIRRRQAELQHIARSCGRSALERLVSPYSLLTAVALGFLAGGGVSRRQPRQGDAARKSGIVGLVGTVAFALLRARFGSPALIAELILSQVRSRTRRPA